MSINVSEVIWTILCFFALLFVLKKLLFDPLVRFMDQRQASIDEGLATGREARQRKDESDAALQERWKERSLEAKQLLAEGKATDDQERTWVLENARKEADQALEEARKHMDLEQAQVQAEAARQMPELISALAEQLLGGYPAGEEQ